MNRYIQLSQGHLNLFSCCPRKFQHAYLDQLGSAVSPEQYAQQQWGTRFHQLMQQRELGLPIESLVQADVQLDRCLTAFIQAAPDILTLDPDLPTQRFRQSEHQRSLKADRYLLVVVYDLLIADRYSAQILDWKTYARPRNQRWLEENWQTRLYPFVLAETSLYAPEQISITYWFVRSHADRCDRTPEPQCLRFPYHTAAHEKTRQDLNVLLSQLSDYLERYQDANEPLPQIEENQGHCLTCPFALRCQRQSSPRAKTSNLVPDPTVEETVFPDLADIEEVVL